MPLPLPAGGRRRVAGYDLTFSAPKSASVVFALGGEEAARGVVAAHEQAVAGAPAMKALGSDIKTGSEEAAAKTKDAAGQAGDKLKEGAKTAADKTDQAFSKK